MQQIKSLSQTNNTQVAFLASIIFAYMEVLWEGKPVEETELAGYYAAAGEISWTPSSWDGRREMMKRLSPEHADARGQTNLAQLFIGVLIAGIVAIRVFIPTVNDAINNSNVSGTTKTILGLLGLFAALLLLISLASPLMQRT